MTEEAASRPVEDGIVKRKSKPLYQVLVITGQNKHQEHLSKLRSTPSLAVESCNTRSAVYGAAHENKYDLVILADLSGRNRISKAVTFLFQQPWYTAIPVLALGSVSAKKSSTILDFIYHRLPDDVSPAECAGWVTAVLKRTKFLREMSPDTGLPGQGWLHRQIEDRIERNENFACVYFDIDRFKPVVDVYGWGRAGDFIRALADALMVAAKSARAPAPLVSHIGGDDFVVICDPSQVLPLTKMVITKFESSADSLYDSADAERGYLLVPDRRGGQQRAALVTLSIGAAESMSRSSRFASMHELFAIAAEMKKVAKSQPGSYVAIDRRA